MAGNRYLADNFGPVQEETTETNLRVTGTIPPELNGRYLRNGPNPLGTVDVAKHHWFTGHGMVHGVRLGDGRARWYRNRWVRSADIVAALGEDTAGRTLGGSNNTHVIGLAGRTWALVEAGAPPVELSSELDTLGVNAFFGTLTGGGFTAHPKLDPDTGDLHAMCYGWPDGNYQLRYVHVGCDGRVMRTVVVPVPGAVMVHDMSLTQRYAVVFDLPVTMNVEAARSGARFPFVWDDGYAPRVGLLPRDGAASDVVWVDAPACYVFHPMNAYDDADGRVVVDVCRYDRMFSADRNGPFGDSLPTLERWTIDVARRRLDARRIDDRAQEFPRCNPMRSSKSYRYGYSVAIGDSGRSFPSVFKHDLAKGTTSQFDFGPGRHGAEPFFVPREGATAEDDGYLLAFVYDANVGASELTILDARDLRAAPLARVHLPARVPFGFHGSWIADGAGLASV